MPAPGGASRHPAKAALLLAPLLAIGLAPLPALALARDAAAAGAEYSSHLFLDGSFAVPAAPSEFSRDWAGGAGFGLGWVLPVSATRAWSLRLGDNSFGFIPTRALDARVGIVSLALSHRLVVRPNALAPYVRIAGGGAYVGWQDATAGSGFASSTGHRSWGGYAEVGAGVRPVFKGAAVRPFADVSWAAAFTGAKVGPRSLHTVLTRLGIEFVSEESEREIETRRAGAEAGPVGGAREAGGAPAGGTSEGQASGESGTPATPPPAPGAGASSGSSGAGGVPGDEHAPVAREPASRFFACAGAAFPGGTDGAPDYWGAGPGLEVGGEFRIVERAAFLLTYSVDWVGFDAQRFRDANGFPPGTPVSGETAVISDFQAGLRIRAFSRGGWHGYADALVGRAAFTAKYRGVYSGPGIYRYVSADVTEGGASWSIGLGARRTPPDGLGWFVDAHWVSLGIFDGTWRYAPVRVGVLWR